MSKIERILTDIEKCVSPEAFDFYVEDICGIFVSYEGNSEKYKSLVKGLTILLNMALFDHIDRDEIVLNSGGKSLKIARLSFIKDDNKEVVAELIENLNSLYIFISREMEIGGFHRHSKFNFMEFIELLSVPSLTEEILEDILSLDRIVELVAWDGVTYAYANVRKKIKAANILKKFPKISLLALKKIDREWQFNKTHRISLFFPSATCNYTNLSAMNELRKTFGLDRLISEIASRVDDQVTKVDQSLHAFDLEFPQYLFKIHGIGVEWVLAGDIREMISKGNKQASELAILSMELELIKGYLVLAQYMEEYRLDANTLGKAEKKIKALELKIQFKGWK